MTTSFAKYHNSNTDLRKYIGAFEISGSTWRVYHDAGHTDIASSGALTHRYYVRDYLGSTRTVIDEEGNVLQSTAYYPSGVPLTPNDLAPQTIKLHTGKDLFDLQGAGWYDNHARYYDCLLGRFTTQDPLAEKYPGLNPYNHCANNPLKFVDKDGMRISYIENGIEYVYADYGDSRGFYDVYGNPYSGQAEFVRKLTTALSEIQSVSEGQSVVSELITSKYTFEIKEGANGFQATSNYYAQLKRKIPNITSKFGSGGIISWNPANRIGGPDVTESFNRDSYIGLAHELGHADAANKGVYNLERYGTNHKDKELQNVTKDEYNATTGIIPPFARPDAKVIA